MENYYKKKQNHVIIYKSIDWISLMYVQPQFMIASPYIG